jgi:hypothetical protein
LRVEEGKEERVVWRRGGGIGGWRWEGMERDEEGWEGMERWQGGMGGMGRDGGF